MTSVIYASLCAFTIVWLSLQVIKIRHREKVSIGDGNLAPLTIAMAAHSNAIEYIPIALLLLFALEFNAAPIAIVHAFGIALVLGRAIHARALLTENLANRVRGMQITIWTIIGLALTNLVYLPYSRLIEF